jgi:outer membrane protein assembly factor BamD
MIKKLFFLITIFVLFDSCTKQTVKESVLKENSIDLQVQEAYEEGVKALEDGDVLYAAKKFNEAELIYPQSEWAPRSSLMSAYAFYKFQYYKNSTEELRRFIKLYSNNENIDYAYYLLAMCYYESIVDETKDLKPLTQAKKYFEIVLKEYSNTDYALDAKYKLELINDILAAKEIYIARHYIKKEKWIAAINRFKTILNDYDTTIYTEEAIHRLVEIHYKIGLEGEAKKYASLLGYNYLSSEWYGKTYNIFNKKYEVDKIKSEKKSLKEKFKKLF